MAVKRIIYGIILLASVAALIITNSAVALFLCMSLFVLPLLSLVLLLVASKRVRFDCKMRESCIRGGALELTMRVGVSPRFLVGGAKVTAVIENTTFHKSHEKSFIFKDLSFSPHTYGYNGADSGRICVGFRDIELIDIFGIFSVKVKCSAFAESVVSPVLYEGIRVNVGNNGNDSLYGETSFPEKGSDITEIYNVRDYLPGDSLGTVHWKLSGKFGSLKSKEFGRTDDRKILVLVDMSREKFGVKACDGQLNAVLDVAVSISDSLKTGGFAHSVGWFTDGTFECCEVSDGNTFVEAVKKLMSVKVKEGNEEELFYFSRNAECSSFTKIVFISSSVHSEELKQCSGVDITAIAIGDTVGEISERGVRIINVPQDSVETALAVCVI